MLHYVIKKTIQSTLFSMKNGYADDAKKYHNGY